MDIGNQRQRIVCRLHSLLSELAPGGIAKELYVSDANTLLAILDPQTPTQQLRFDLVLELLDDVRRLDTQIKESHHRIKVAIKASGTSVTEVYGVGPIHAAALIGYSGDITRFANRDAYASYNGTAPIEWSSGGRVVHRVSRRGNRKLNHALHMAAITQLRNPGTQGRIYFERKVAEGKTKKEAVRSLKRQISNSVYRQLLLDAR
jgi:transposase